MAVSKSQEALVERQKARKEGGMEGGKGKKKKKNPNKETPALNPNSER